MMHVSIDITTPRLSTSHGYGSGKTHDEILRQHGEMVRRIAWHVYSRVSSSLEIEDLIQTGLVALLEAARVYEDRGYAFATYASTRVRGAMIDQLRKEARMTRSAMQARRKLSGTRGTLEQKLMRPPSSIEMATELGLDVEAYHNLVANSVSVEDGSIDDLYTDQTMEFADQCERADNEMENAELRKLLSNCIADLPEREALVLQLFFVEERNLDEIGSILGVGAARVCQIKKKAIERLQVSMQADA